LSSFDLGVFFALQAAACIFSVTSTFGSPKSFMIGFAFFSLTIGAFKILMKVYTKYGILVRGTEMSISNLELGVFCGFCRGEK